MANLKSLAKDTAIYGLSSIIGRFLNYLLVPLYQRRKWWLWCHHQHVRLYGVTPRYPDLWNGDHLLPLCQQGGRKF